MGFNQPINVVHDFFPLAASMPRKDVGSIVQESSSVCLALSLSCDHHHDQSSSTVTIDEGKRDTTTTMMKKRVGFSSLEAESDISMELTLGGVYTHHQSIDDKVAGKRPVINEATHNNKRKPKVLMEKGISLELTLGFSKPNCTISKKRERRTVENNNDSCCTSGSVNSYKRSKADKEKMIIIKSNVANVNNNNADHQYYPWRIRKKLTKSDLDGLSRLLLKREWVDSHVYPFWNADQRARIGEGLPVAVWDCDTNTRHELIYKQWSSSGANVLKGKWIQDFVKRRGLKEDDEIGLYWDQLTSEFKFSLLNPA